MTVHGLRGMALSIASLLVLLTVAWQGMAVAQNVWMVESDGSIQCQLSSIGPDKTLELLKKSGIPVLKICAAWDGEYWPAACGYPTGRLNAFLIPSALAEKARSLSCGGQGETAVCTGLQDPPTKMVVLSPCGDR